jgi:hypothetical protein
VAGDLKAPDSAAGGGAAKTKKTRGTPTYYRVTVRVSDLFASSCFHALCLGFPLSHVGFLLEKENRDACNSKENTLLMMILLHVEEILAT